MLYQAGGRSPEESSVVMEQSNSKENADEDAEVLSPLVPQKKSYAAAVAHRESRPPARILAKEDNEEKREALVLKGLTWRTQAPIEERVKKIKEVPRDSPLKNRIDSTHFVYFQGITKQRLGEVRKSLAALKIETKEVKDISFVGK